MKKRLFCILMTVCMMISLLPTASFAASSTPGYENYVAMGSSITGGYGIELNTYSWGSYTWTSPSIPGAFGDDGTFASIIADNYGIEGRYDGALLGTRCVEYRILLEDDYHGDDYTEEEVGPKCGNDEEHLKEISAEYKAALAEADLITLEIGSNDVFSMIEFEVGNMLREDAENAEEAEQESATEALDEIDEEIGFAKALFADFAVADDLGEYPEMIEKALEVKETAMSAFKENFDAVISDIREINPDADLLVYGIYNPFPYLMECEVTNNQNGTKDYQEMVLECGQMLDLTTEQTTQIFSTITDSIVDEQNYYTQYESSQKNNYTWISTTGIDMTGSTDGTHPAYAGHAYLAEGAISAIDEMYGECRHLHQVTKYAFAPTQFTLGYTGLVYCSDCGELISSGSFITYSQYQEQQDVGTIETDPGEEEVPVTPIDISDKDYPEDEDNYVLGFTSDIHNQDGNVSATRLSGWLDSAQENWGEMDFFGSCGDTANGATSMTSDAYWNLVSPAVTAVDNSNIDNWVFTTGNHEQQQGQYNSTYNTNDIAKMFTMVGEVDVDSDANYRVFAFGATQSSAAFTDENIATLKAYLDDCKAEDALRPVFVLSHFPLHNEGSRTISNKDAVIELLNNYPNVIFLWGHDHTDAATTETHYDQVYTGSIDGTPIKFTYAAAGCMSDSEYSTGSAAVKGKGLVVKVEKEDDPEEAPDIEMTYTNAEGGSIGTSYEINIGESGTEVETIPAYEGTFELAETPVAGRQYAIVYNGQALNTTYCSGYTNNSSYSYSGFKGEEVTVGDSNVTGLSADSVWLFENAGSNAFYIKNVYTGRYLNATYASNSSGAKDGKLFLAETKDTWTYSNGVFKSSTASKNLAYDVEGDISPTPYTGVYDFFTVRSTGDAVTLYDLGLPEEETEAIPAVEGTFAKASAPAAQQQYAIVYNGQALNTTYCGGYTNNSSYSYSGFKGEKVTVGESGVTGLSADSVWLFEDAGSNAFYIKNVYTGRYLSATYSSSAPKGGSVFLSDTADKWTYSNGILTSTAAGKKFAYDEEKDISPTPYTGEYDFFTVRSSGDVVTLYAVTAEIEPETEPSETEEVESLSTTTVLKDGHKYLISSNGYLLTSDVNAGYLNTSGYSYTGFDGVSAEFTLGKLSSWISKNMVWECEAVSGGAFTLRNASADEGYGYLNSAYGTNQTGHLGGELTLDESGEYSAWTISNGKLMGSKSTKYLTYDTTAQSELTSGSSGFFTIRSESNAAAILFYEVTDETAVHEVTEEQPVTLTNCAASSAVSDGKAFLINYGNRALVTTANDGYTLSTGEIYKGLDGKTILIYDDGTLNPANLTSNCLWIFEKVSGSHYSIRNMFTGQYLNAVYDSSASTSTLELVSAKEDAQTWRFNGTQLTSDATGRVLAFDTKSSVTGDYEGNLNLFTLKTSSSDIRLYYVDTDDVTLTAPSAEEMLGSCVGWKQVSIGNGTYVLVLNGYAVGIQNEAFVTTKLDDTASIYELGDDYLWTIKLSNSMYSLQNVGSGKYLGYYTKSTLFSTTVTPYISSSAVLFSSSNNLSASVSRKTFLSRRTTTYYLTCSNGSLSMSTSDVGSTAKFYKEVQSDTHSITTSVNGDTTDYTCSVCGHTYTAKTA